MQEPSPSSPEAGSVVARMRQVDWRLTPLGPQSDWPLALRSPLDICLDASFPIAIYWGPQRALLYNDAWSPILGDKHPWALGRPAREVWPEIWNTIGPWFEQVFATGKTIHSNDPLVAMHRHGDTEACGFDHSFSPLRDDSGQVMGVFNVVLERTALHVGERHTHVPNEPREPPARASGLLALARARDALAASNSALRESEQSFRELAEAMPQIVYVTDARGRAEYLNAQWREFTGQSAAQHDLDAAVHPDDLPRLRSQWQYALDQGTMLTSEFRLRRHDGEHQWVLTRAIPVRDERGRVTRWFGTSTNIDAHKRRAEALMRAHQQLQVSERRKDEFLATLAHELRNPLAPLRHALQLLQRGGDPSGAATLHAMMQRQVDQLVRLVDDLLEVARINHGKIELERRPVLLGSVLDSAIETCRPLIDQTGVRLELRADIADLFVEGDALRLAQVFVNLLNNAAKYSHPGGRVVIAARRDGEEAVVSLRDEGIGIAPEMLPRVFDIFVQAPGAAVHAADGLGIGLSLVSTLLALHGGRIEARSEGVGLGSEFIVRLPALAGQTAARPAPNARAPMDHEASGGAIEVLVCDDNRDAADSLGDLLRVLGARPRVVYDGPATLAAVRQQRPQLVLLDIGMPGMDGHAVARALRALPDSSSMKLAALTGWAQPQDRERTRASGFDRHFVKPIDIDALRSLLDAVAQAASTDLRSVG